MDSASSAEAHYSSDNAAADITPAAASSSSQPWRRPRAYSTTSEPENSQQQQQPAGLAAIVSTASHFPRRTSEFEPHTLHNRTVGSPSSQPSSGANTPSHRGLNIDAEDEDVKIAIMALGAMRHLDGRSSAASVSPLSNSLSNLDQDSSMEEDSRRLKADLDSASSRTLSLTSISSDTSTSLSVPSALSTPVTELTQPSLAASSSSGRAPYSSIESSIESATTLSEIPDDVEFSALVYDEDGNEIRVDNDMLADADFLRRVSHLPIVRGTLRAYELGKQRSKALKYGADFVESSVKSISRPVVSRLNARLGEKGVEQLDGFACRQLDKLYPQADHSPSKEEQASIMAELDQKEQTDWKGMSEEERLKRRQAYWSLRMDERDRQLVANELRQRRGKGKGRAKDTSTIRSTDSASTGSGWVADSSDNGEAGFVSADSIIPSSDIVRSQEGMRAVREGAGPSSNGRGGRWGSMLVEAGMTAGGLSAAMSEESMKSMQYCLHWLQYATAHIEYQITVLRDLIVKLNHGELDLSSASGHNLSSINGDVVGTMRSFVDVMSKYAAAALPEPARRTVKAFILSLPARWATVNRAPETVAGARASFGHTPVSPSFSPAHLGGSRNVSSTNQHARQQAVTQQREQTAAAAQAATRILTLAVESLDILRSVTVVFGESLDRADLWMERLRAIGMHRKRQHEHRERVTARGENDGYASGDAEWADWETPSNAGDRSAGRYGSPGAESNASAGTAASGTTKRRRVKADRDGGRGSADRHEGIESHSGTSSPTPAFVPGTSGGTSSAVHGGYGHTHSSAQHSHYSHHHGQSGTAGGSSSRRRTGRTSGNRSRASSNVRTPNFQYTPLRAETPDPMLAAASASYSSPPSQAVPSSTTRRMDVDA